VLLLLPVGEPAELDGVELTPAEEELDEVLEASPVLVDVSVVVLASTVEGDCVTCAVVVVALRGKGTGTTVLVTIAVVSGSTALCAGEALQKSRNCWNCGSTYVCRLDLVSSPLAATQAWQELRARLKAESGAQRAVVLPSL